MPRPSSIEAGDVVERIARGAPGAAEKGPSGPARRGRVDKVEKVTALVAWDGTHGRKERERVPLSILRVIEDATSERPAVIEARPAARAPAPVPVAVPAPTRPMTDVAGEVAALRDMARALVARAEARLDEEREIVSAIEAELEAARASMQRAANDLDDAKQLAGGVR